MSDTDNSPFPGFGKFVPGFDFLQNLATQAAGTAQKLPQLPGLGSWVAPTLNVEELDKRIQEFKAVQFWLDQNALALKATIQALEVQKMTLATLKGMNFNMGDVADAFKLKTSAGSIAGSTPLASDKPKTFSGLEIPPTNFEGRKPSSDEVASAASAPSATGEEKSSAAAGAPASGVVDPMQWWGALTQQFQNIAANAMKDVTQKPVGKSAGKPSAGQTGDAPQSASGMASDIAKSMAESAGKMVSGATQALRSSQAWPLPEASAKTAKPKAAARGKPKPKPAARAARKSTR
jgi:hypothetical protein